MSYLFRVIIVIKFLLLFVLAALCSQSFAAPDKQLLRRLDIQRGLFADTYQSFEIDEQSVIYVLQENTTAITRGVALLVADTGIPIVGSEGFAALANELNKIGWVTILLPAPDSGFMPTIQQESIAIEENEDIAAEIETISPPETPEPNPAELPETLDISKSAVTIIDNLAFLQHEQQLVALLQAATEKAQEYPGFLLVISKGTSAAWLSKIYTEKTLENPDAFVAISPFWPDRKHNQRLPFWIANTPMPVLDLFSGWDNGWAQMTVAQRKIAAIKALKLQYRQRELLGFNTSLHQSDYISKEIYGWISRMGW
ncbi:DUF3530 family protein [uncultured Paraglaciecola sp.]|uniref:DUF3530 family protein n=1 Tax=uncultured Paraglaciecola sp. TaxID=1765024 RepID=UPI0030D96614